MCVQLRLRVHLYFQEAALAGLRELQLRQKTGELVLRSVANKVLFEATRQVRDRFQNIPARLSGILAAERNQAKIFELLTREIHQALEDLAS
jgi:hypothetical protein